MVQAATAHDCAPTSILCVLPTSWPMSPGGQKAVYTWVQSCSRTVLAARAEQLKRPTSLHLKSGQSVDVLVSHNHSELGRARLLDVWYDVREALRVAALQCELSSFEWLLLAETDAYVSMHRLHRYLIGRQLSPADAHVIGQCHHYEEFWHGLSQGVLLFSRGAVQRLLPVLDSCEPFGGGKRFAGQVPSASGQEAGGAGFGAGDKSIGPCLQRAHIACEAARDGRGHDLIGASPQNELEVRNQTQGLAYGATSERAFALHDGKYSRINLKDPKQMYLSHMHLSAQRTHPSPDA